MTRRPVLLDLFCGAGGAAQGYYRAGFDVIGIDIKPQRHYPFEFKEADALEVLRDHAWWRPIAAVHASPPCQRYSRSAHNREQYPDLLGPTRQALNALGLPWVIENVPGAPMRADYKLCGCLFSLELRRVRWFETSWAAFGLRPPCTHDHPVPCVVGHGTPSGTRKALGRNVGIAELRECMGIDWMTRNELSQAIPPAYTEYVGRRLIDRLGTSERRTLWTDAFSA